MKAWHIVAVVLILAAAWVATVAMLGAEALILLIPGIPIVAAWLIGRE